MKPKTKTPKLIKRRRQLSAILEETLYEIKKQTALMRKRDAAQARRAAKEHKAYWPWPIF